MTFRNALLATVLVASTLRSWDSARSPGTDFQIYCAAIRASDAGRNLYNVAALQEAGSPVSLPMTNPALMLPLVRPACAMGTHIPLWWAAIGATILLTGTVVKSTDWLLLATLVTGGFDAARWMLLTGNIAVFEMLLVSIGIAALVRSRTSLFSLTVGAATFLKLMPAAFVAVAWAVGGPRRFFLAAAGVAGVFAALHAIYGWFMPDSAAAYWALLFGGFAQFLGTEAVHGATTHPSTLSALMDVSSAVTGRTWPAVPVYTAVALLIARDLFRLTRRSRKTTDLVALWGLGLLLAMPRLKPYALGLGIMPLYLATTGMPARLQILMVLVSCLVPFAAAGMHRYSGLVMLEYGQLYALGGAYLLARAALAFPPPRQRYTADGSEKTL